MSRSRWLSIYACLFLLVLAASPALAQPSDEAAAIAAIEAAGGTVRQIAQNTDEREVSFHPGGHAIGDDVLASVPLVAKVTRLDLRQTQVTDAGLAALAEMTDLVRLHLEQTQVTDAGLAHLAGLTNLEYLNLYGTEVSDAGLDALAGLTNLEKLYLWETEVTADGAAALADKLPETSIVLGADIRPPAIADAPTTTLAVGRTLQVRLEGEERILSLAEVQVIEPVTGAQLQVGGTANQSSVAYGGAPQRASDGNTNPAFSAGSVTHTDTEANPFWSVDLGADKAIGAITVYNRGDCCGDRLIGAIVEVLDSGGNVVWSATIDTAETGSLHEFQMPAEGDQPAEEAPAESAEPAAEAETAGGEVATEPATESVDESAAETPAEPEPVEEAAPAPEATPEPSAEPAAEESTEPAAESEVTADAEAEVIEGIDADEAGEANAGENSGQ